MNRLGVPAEDEVGNLHAKLIDLALKKYGSVRRIATELELDQSNLNRQVCAKKLAPRYAHCIARDLGQNEIRALIEAHALGSRSDGEREYWQRELQRLIEVVE